MATLSDEYLVKLEEALNLYREYIERDKDQIHITFITVLQ